MKFENTERMKQGNLMNKDEFLKTYPEYTVYIHYSDFNEVDSIQTFNFYANRRKTYEDCKIALTKRLSYKEVQDKTLYEVAKLLENEKEKSKGLDKQDILDNLREISNVVDNLIWDLEQEEFDEV